MINVEERENQGEIAMTREYKIIFFKDISLKFIVQKIYSNIIENNNSVEYCFAS